MSAPALPHRQSGIRAGRRATCLGSSSVGFSGSEIAAPVAALRSVGTGSPAPSILESRPLTLKRPLDEATDLFGAGTMLGLAARLAHGRRAPQGKTKLPIGFRTSF